MAIVLLYEYLITCLTWQMHVLLQGATHGQPLLADADHCGPHVGPLLRQYRSLPIWNSGSPAMLLVLDIVLHIHQMPTRNLDHVRVKNVRLLRRDSCRSVTAPTTAASANRFAGPIR